MRFWPVVFASLVISICIGCGEQAKVEAPIPTPSAAPVQSSQTFALTDLQRIYRDYGPLYVREGERERTLRHRPWSAWWYPIRGRELFTSKDGNASPLKKYDTYMKSVRGTETHAAAFEEKNLYDPNAEAWEGLCHAWALVSLVYPEPKKTLTRGGITFSPTDQKALLIKAYEQYVIDYYGQRPADYSESEWSNIQPQFFHRFVTGELIERGRPFIMNKVPGLEVWNIPIWQASTLLTKDATDPSVYHVKTTTVGTALLERPDSEVKDRVEVNTYTYDLFTFKDATGGDLVFAGKWTGISRDAHPSILMAIPRLPIPHRSKNTEIDNEAVEEILGL